MGFSRQEYWRGLPCPPPGDLPNPWIEPRTPASQADSLHSEPPGKPKFIYIFDLMKWSVFVLSEDDSHSPKFRPSLGHSVSTSCLLLQPQFSTWVQNSWSVPDTTKHQDSPGSWLLPNSEHINQVLTPFNASVRQIRVCYC